MCGRYVNTTPLEGLIDEFDVDAPPLETHPDYNVAPGRNVLAVINDGKNRLVECRWGLIPHWAKEASVGYKIINARSETVAEKASYKMPFRKHRCLVVADGFFEWRKDGKRKALFYFFLKSGKPFGFVGLYSHWTSPEGEKVCTCTILTTEANDVVPHVHDRMPVIVVKDSESLWLDPSIEDYASLSPVMKPYEPSLMSSYEVSTIVNSPANNTPENIKTL